MEKEPPGRGALPAISLTYRRTSRLSMRIGRGGELRVSAPFGTPEARVRAFILEHADWIRQARARMAAAGERRESFYDRLPLHTPAERRLAAQRLTAFLDVRLARYAPLMGVPLPRVSLSRMTSRWGWCKPHAGEVRFSLYLLLLPDWCAESVVVHELAHFLVPNHGPAFYAVMDRHYPRWREARRHIRLLLAGGGRE